MNVCLIFVNTKKHGFVHAADGTLIRTLTAVYAFKMSIGRFLSRLDGSRSP